MVDVTLSILALIGGGLILELFAAALPPLGSETEQGFRLPAQASETTVEAPGGNPS